jgi:diadenosine tetraphosphate (Ap4A) HIT family hydrolase
MADECPLCATVAGRSTTPGGVVHDDGLWLVVHHPGSFADPGELLLILRRHTESLGDLSDAEATALGLVLRGGVGAIERVVEPERVYAASYNERVRHVHFFLLPRTGALPAGHVTSDLFRRARGLLRGWRLARNPSPAERAEAATRIRNDPAWSRTRD